MPSDVERNKAVVAEFDAILNTHDLSCLDELCTPDMVNHGWSKQSLKPGDQVTVTVEPVRNGKPIGRVIQVVLPDGKKLGGGFGSSPPRVGAQWGGNAGAAAPGSGYPKE